MSEKNGYGKGFFTGLLGGGVVVAIVALLFAPKSGKELRKDIKDKTDKYYDDTEKLLSEAKLKAKEVVNNGLKIFTDAKTRTDTIISTGKGVLDNEKSKLKTAFQAGVNAYSETVNQKNEHS